MSSCSLDDKPVDVVDILPRLKTLSSAEDFFDALSVKYDPKVLASARLHVLKRMGQYLATEDFDGLPDRVIAARCRSYLERAYDDFVTSSPLKERVFKVLKDNDPDRPVKPGTAFVDFDDILAPLPPRG
ncbi:nitrogenase stabilizing/protective protein NifW [Siculibacillus lacustris]|uniref:Nitrogenase-stabilizing/protective protein NifW n=1 Tax=Siculibacillus lacustris TaxID=1549641 RepID=A0A4Q9VVG3_9HYPH|nr:nitrogenase stabilizing/protective protein NifW [Siculibacillus lacustris]TBW39028.1 nitrogenase stabilizing/protective protein NifW [Siculibacillus lacustris]